jgi:hypothetical protein
VDCATSGNTCDSSGQCSCGADSNCSSANGDVCVDTGYAAYCCSATLTCSTYDPTFCAGFSGVSGCLAPGGGYGNGYCCP